MPRTKLMAANWKMYKTPTRPASSSTVSFPWSRTTRATKLRCYPPFVCVHAAVEAARGSNVSIGGQNMHWEKEGAFTGEISSGMLLAVGCTHVIIGHSERRQYFGETDDTVNLKAKAALEAGLSPSSVWEKCSKSVKPG